MTICSSLSHRTYLVGVVVERLAALILVPHRITAAAFAHIDRLVRELRVALLKLVPRLVREPLHPSIVSEKKSV